MAAFLTGGCSEGEPFGHPSAEREKRVEVSFRLEAVGTDVSLVPMTRATSYTQWFRNTARLLILKKADTRWIVDTTQTVLLDGAMGRTEDRRGSSAVPVQSRTAAGRLPDRSRNQLGVGRLEQRSGSGESRLR